MYSVGSVIFFCFNGYVLVLECGSSEDVAFVSNSEDELQTMIIALDKQRRPVGLKVICIKPK